MKVWFRASAILLTGAVVGCSRPADLSFVSSTQVAKLKPELQEKVRSILLDRCGTPQSPRLLGQHGCSQGPPETRRERSTRDIAFSATASRATATGSRRFT